MAAGDTLDFVVGWGSNGNYAYDSTGLVLNVAPDGGSPYDDTKMVVSGVIEAEHFNNGGEGIAYHDNTPGTNVQSRPAAHPSHAHFPAAHGRRHLQVYLLQQRLPDHVTGGEWLKYAIDVSATGTYALEVRTAWVITPAAPST